MARLAAPVLALGLLGLISVKFPQLLGNGSDLSQLLYRGRDYIFRASAAASNSQACCDCDVSGKRHARWLIHSLL
jgi:hypothetical protein